MRKLLIAIMAVLLSLTGMAQKIRGSVKKNADPTKIDIVFKPDYTNVSGEYVNYIQFSLAIPAAGNTGVSISSAVAQNAFQDIGSIAPDGPYLESTGELVWNFVFLNPSPPSTNHYIWTANQEFTGFTVTFGTANAALVGKMVDFSNNETGYGGSVGNTLFGVVTNTGDKTDFGNLFYAIPGSSQLGNYTSNNDQYVQTLSCDGAIGGTASGDATYCVSGTPTITASGYSSGPNSGYQWQYSNDNFTTDVHDFTGQTNPASLSTGVVTSTTYYRLKVTCAVGISTAYSNTVTVTINQNVNPGTVSGTSPLCIGASALYTSNGDAGGTWSSSNTAVATVDPTTGLVTATGAGTTNITYTLTSGCGSPASSSKVLTVNANASAGTVSGTSPLCIGGTATYTSNGNSGGTWSSSNTSVATVNATSGAVTAVGAGTTNITYTVNSGCNAPVSSSQSLTVNANASAGTVSGISPLCIGSSSTYTSNGDAGGSWSSSNTSVATVDASSGVVTAVAAGTTTITYSVTAGCNVPVSSSQSLTVNANASAGTVSGTSPLCIGASATYTSNGDAGGTWSSSNTSVATVDASGVVTAVGAGSTNITYTVSSGCNAPASASKSLTVNPNANAGMVSGSSPLCIGASATYTSNGDAGGTWSSSNTSVATVNATSGVVTATGAGSTNITYTVSGCNGPATASQTLTVSPNASAGTVSGTSPLCIGASATYTSNGDAGGTWSSSNTAVATVDASGVVTAVAAGSTMITYTVSSGCNAPASASQTLTVSPNASAGTVSGTSPLCIGASATYTSNGDAGGTWSSDNTSVATVDASGVVTATGAGTATITYTVSAGCNAPVSSSKILTVNPNANAGTVSGTSPLCIGSSATYTSDGDAGGTWSSSNTAVATVNAASGVVTATGAGTTMITYTVSGCNGPATASQSLTVDPNANAGTVSGTSPLCIGASATYTSNGDAGGTWSSSNTAVATVDASTGVVTAVSAGSTMITYTVSSGCNAPVSASQSLTVSPNANAGTVSGSSPLCIGASATYTSNGDAGGTWSSSNTAVATVNASTGVVTAVGAGTTTITYSVSGCGTDAASQSLTVDPNASAGTVSGTSPLCIGSTAQYTSDGDAGGTWSSSNMSVATVDASGLVTAVGAGSTMITYTVSTGCNAPVSSSQSLTVNANASAGTVSGTSPLCIRQTVTYSSNGDAGGTWSSSNPAVATVDASTGEVTAVDAGTTMITYTVSSGCNAPVSSSQSLTVNPDANAGTVSGTSPLCIGSSATYSSTGDAGGTWSSSNTAVATVNATSGVVTAVGAGTTNITYTVNGCNGPSVALQSLTVSPNASAGTVSGTSPLCIGTSATYSSTGDAGGTWSSSNTTVATVDASTGVVTAVAAGTTMITYTVSTGCNAPASASQSLTVSPNATAGTVSGTSPLCIGQTVTYTSNGNAGGTWSSDNASVATVNATTGAVTATGAGTATITYTVTAGCNGPASASKTVTVNPNANAGTVSGTSPLCSGQTATYTSDGDAGGTWSSSNTAVATVNATTGVVTAVSAGTTTIRYTVTAGCNAPVSASQSLTVSPNANAGTVSGTSPLCIGATATYTSNGNSGGTWSSSNTSVATVDATTGVVTAVSAGTANITYTVSSGCNAPASASKSLTVNANANAGTVSGTSPLCIGQTSTYTSNGNSGGTWSSSNTAVATVNATSGLVTAVAAGTADIRYTVTAGCNAPAMSFKTLTVNANASAGTVSGTSPLCIGQTSTYTSNGNSGGTWSSSNTSVATVNPSTGVVTAVAAGTANITYTVTGCGPVSSASKALTVNPNVVGATAVNGTTPLCAGSSATYTQTGGASGGTWSSDNTSVATVNATTGVVTAVAAGTANITYTVNGCGGPVSKSKTLTVVGPYTITASAGSNGSISPSGNVTVTCGGRQTFTMTPDPCYHIATVLVDGVNDPNAVMSGSYTFDNVNANHTISVTFASSGPFNITSSAGPNGTIAPLGTETVACSGNSSTYTMTANSGYHIYQVLIDGTNNPAAVSSGTYTFTNVQSDHTIHVTFASNCTATTVTISANSDPFCGNLTLTAVPANPGTYTYQWYRNAMPIAGANSQTYSLTTASADGHYTVTATGGTCTSTPSPAYTYNKQNTLQSYTLLATDEDMNLGESNTVLHGSVGHTAKNGKISMKKNATVASAGAFVKAKSITIDNPSNVPTRILGQVMVTLPAMQHATTISGLRNVTVSSNQTLNNNWNDVTVKKNVVVTITGTNFHNINIEDGAQVTFTQPVINANQLNVGTNGGPGNVTRVKFSTDCSVRMKDKVTVDENCIINATSQRVVLYMDGNVTVSSKNTYVRASIYAPDGKITVNGDNTVSGYMTGRFIAKDITSTSKNVIWDNFDCANPPAPMFSEQPLYEVARTIVTASKPKVEETANKLEVTAYPNPSANRFNLALKTTKTNTQVMVRIIDIYGKVRQELKGNPDQIFRVGENLLPGMYMAEVIQGTEKITVKLIKE